MLDVLIWVQKGILCVECIFNLRGEVNVGQLCRERFGDAVFNIGFLGNGMHDGLGHTGTVTAANSWGQPAGTHLS